MGRDIRCLLDYENSNIPQKPLTITQLIEIGQIKSENIVTTVSEVGIVMNDDCLHQILKHMPVMYLKCSGLKTDQPGVFLNLQEFIYTPGAIEALLNCSESTSDEDCNVTESSSEGTEKSQLKVNPCMTQPNPVGSHQ